MQTFGHAGHRGKRTDRSWRGGGCGCGRRERRAARRPGSHRRGAARLVAAGGRGWGGLAAWLEGSGRTAG
eukprot:5059532-Prymnesium_polylepis.1